MKHLLLLIALFSINSSFSQIGIGTDSSRELHNVENLYFSEYTNEVTGDLYLFKEWKKCVVKTNLKKDGLTLILSCNYNLFTDQFEMKIDDEIHFLKKENIVSIHEDETTYKPVNLKNTEEDRNYMEILATGQKYDLVSTHYLKIKDIPNKKALGIFKKNISKHSKLYFIDNQTGELIEVPNSKRKIYKLLELQKTDIQKLSGNIRTVENLKKAVEMI